ncbi:MAG: LolA family protein [Gemmataceae bacterium]
MDEPEVLRRLDALAHVPTPDSKRAIDDTRAALLAEPKPSPSFWSVRTMTRYAAALAAIAAVALLALWLANPFGPGIAFADVQKKVEQTNSVTMTYTGHGGDGQPVTGKAFALADGRMRMEDPDGSYNVIDPKRERSLAVNPKTKEALLVKSYYDRGPADVYQILRDIRKNEVKKLPGEQINGQATEVFLAKVKFGDKEQELKVWVEPKSQLPVRLEVADKDKSGRERKMTIDVKFDQPLDEKLFSTDPPAGYTLRTEGEAGPPVERVKDEKLLAPELKPKVGIGPVTFGMTKEQVIEKLGKPDRSDPKELTLDYTSRGYAITVSPQRGMQGVLCYTQATFAIKVKDFAGKTTEGIAMGTKAADIIKAYGEPDAKETDDGTTRLSYRKLGLEFTLASDKLVMISLSKP